MLIILLTKFISFFFTSGYIYDEQESYHLEPALDIGSGSHRLYKDSDRVIKHRRHGTHPRKVKDSRHLPHRRKREALNPVSLKFHHYSLLQNTLSIKQQRRDTHPKKERMPFTAQEKNPVSLKFHHCSSSVLGLYF